MAETTGIAWTDHTFNPHIGCKRVSPGCAHCYAETFARTRMGLNVWDGKNPAPRKSISDATWKNPIKWNRQAAAAGEQRRVFCASMADVFEDHPVAAESRKRLFPLIEETPHLDWQLLTKRPELVMEMVPAHWQEKFPDNIWMGASAENQSMFNGRIEWLTMIPAKVRFLSCEPLLGPIDMREWLCVDTYPPYYDGSGNPAVEYWYPIDWVIVGGESGPKHRPMKLEWALGIRDQCEEAGVAFFFKQVGGRTSKSGGDLLDGQQYHAFP